MGLISLPTACVFVKIAACLLHIVGRVGETVVDLSSRYETLAFQYIVVVGDVFSPIVISKRVIAFHVTLLPGGHGHLWGVFLLFCLFL